MPEVEALVGVALAVVEGREFADVAVFGVLDTDDVGTEVGEQFGAVDAALVREVEDAEACEGAGHQEVFLDVCLAG
jgi:hypothetical protein